LLFSHFSLLKNRRGPMGPDVCRSCDDVVEVGFADQVVFELSSKHP
jgi:hypothetical protein